MAIHEHGTAPLDWGRFITVGFAVFSVVLLVGSLATRRDNTVKARVERGSVDSSISSATAAHGNSRPPSPTQTPVATVEPRRFDVTGARDVNPVVDQFPAAPIQSAQAQPTLVALSVPPVATPLPRSLDDQFVKRCGSSLCLGGQTYRFVGVNMYDAAGDTRAYYCGPASSNPDAYLESAFKELRAHTGASVVRLWAFQSYTKGGTDWSSFDRVIRAAKRNHLRLIFTLENQWDSCTSSPYKTASWYQSGYQHPYGAYRLSYVQYVTRVVTRYRNDPTILAWELMNEAESADSQGHGDAISLYFFTKRMSHLIRSLDPNHLITLGTIGGGQPGTGGTAYQTLYSLPDISFVAAHDYDAATIALPGSPITNVNTCTNTIACHAAQARRVLHKPFVIDEAGIEIGGRSPWTTSQRAMLFLAKIQAFWNAGGSGYLIWNYSPNEDRSFDFTPQDPLSAVLYVYR